MKITITLDLDDADQLLVILAEEELRQRANASASQRIAQAMFEQRARQEMTDGQYAEARWQAFEWASIDALRRRVIAAWRAAR